MVRAQSSEHVFSLWSWEMVSKLRLHMLEQSDGACQYAICNPREAFSYVPDLDSDASLEPLVTGLREKHPIACYVAVRMTLWGHSVPLICSHSFEQLQILVNSIRYCAECQ